MVHAPQHDQLTYIYIDLGGREIHYWNVNVWVLLLLEIHRELAGGGFCTVYPCRCDLQRVCLHLGMYHVYGFGTGLNPMQDYLTDWSLLRTNARNPLLRDEVLFAGCIPVSQSRVHSYG